ncbi:MAG: magnesium/cobalt transporter CorA [Candidatus Omnitrophota bacterium]
MLQTFLWKKDKGFTTEVSRADMLQALKDKENLLWVDLEDPTDFESECLVEIFNFHDLAVEDCLADHSEPKIDDYEEYLFITTHAPNLVREEGKEREELESKELDIFFGPNFVVTFHKVPFRSIATVQDLVKRKPERWIAQGSDILAHAILDHLVDNYQPFVTQYDRTIDNLEEEIFNNPPSDYLATVMRVKQDIFNFKRTVALQRDMMAHLLRDPEPFIKKKNMMYFRDIQDHLQRLYSAAESFHENLSNILHAYFSYSSHKLNEIVKHLTVIATLAMPALIIGSLYGMNFKYMPELSWPYGYPFAMGISLLITLVLLVWMKIKQWF